jgi:hypothetical protein
LVGAELALEAAEGLLVGAARGGGQIGLGEERRGGLAEQPGGGGEVDDPAGHGGSSGMWQGMRRFRRLACRPGTKVVIFGA